MSFFDDQPPPGPRQRADYCCDHLAELSRLDQFIHVLGHSRVPFSVEMLAGLTGDGRTNVLASIAKACAEGTVAVVEPEQYMDKPTGLYVGQLAKRR